jgi:peroxiredoxin
MSTVVLLVRIALAGVFAVAAVAKLADLEGSRRAMRDFGVPGRAAAGLGLALPLAELAIAAGLLFPPTAQWSAGAAVVLLSAFMVGIAAAMRRGEAPDCHCFGQVHSAPAGRGTLARNALLTALAVLTVVEGPGPAVDTWIADRTGAELVAIAAIVSGLGLASLSLWLWLQRRRLRADLARAHRRAAVATPGIPVGSEAPGFSLESAENDVVTLDALRERGRPILLVFASPSCENCSELLPKLAVWERTLNDRLIVALVSMGSAEAHDGWRQYGFQHLLLQQDAEVYQAYRMRATPAAVLVTPDGRVGSNPAEGVFAIEPLVRLALRDGADAQLAEV